MTRRRWIAAIGLALALGAALRGVWLTSDPPTGRYDVGIVWHDEGAWVHNARNKALWGTWVTDEWNPVFLTPVFTAFEYASFRVCGVGTWQARVVPAASGLLALAFLAAGLRVVSGRRAAAVGAWLLATNFIFVMWNRAALMESTMTALVVVSWGAYALAERRAAWGAVAGAAAALAWFTKASAAFFIAALVAEALYRALDRRDRRAAVSTLASLTLVAGVAGAWFVAPHWRQYVFYNWQMSVTRKPSYAIVDFLTRASWLPVVQTFFTRMWLVFAAGLIGMLAIIARGRNARPAERLLVLWVVVGLAELVAHDSGNERRYVMFIPALIALAAWLVAGAAPAFAASLAEARTRTKALAAPLIAGAAYLAAGSVLRIGLVDRSAAHPYRAAVQISLAAAALTATAAVWRWRSVVGGASRLCSSRMLASVVVVVSVTWNLAWFAAWAVDRRADDYRASIALSGLLPAGTRVEGKLANGLALDNRLRPVFLGNGFGNSVERLGGNDPRYILTIIEPKLGYETPKGLISDVLLHSPGHRVIATFDVATFDADDPGRVDVAALIDKRPAGAGGPGGR